MSTSDPPHKIATFLALDEQGKQVISVLVKRTYAFEQNRLVPADEQEDFVGEDVLEAKEYEPGFFTAAEIDLLPFKLKTDVVVTGEIIAPGERPTTSLTASVEVGGISKVIQVFGERRVEMHGSGAVRFTEPEPFVRMPLTYCRAYGGVDPSVARNEDPQNAGEWLTYITLESHPGVYPRNPVGQCYVVNPLPWLLNGRPLPNFEDPDDLLSPERIVVQEPENWWRQPMPAGFGWFSKSWYPRSILGGLLPPFPPDEREVRETRLGLMAPDHHTSAKLADLGDKVQLEFFNGASPGLAVPRLQGGEQMCIGGMDPEGDFRFDLPHESPRIAVSFKGKALEVALQLQTVWIRKDEGMATLVWSGNARPPRMLPLTLPTREEYMVDELEGVEIRVDGQEVPHEPEDMGKTPF